MAIEHYEGLIALYGRPTGIRHARKHLAAYADAAAAAGFAIRPEDRLTLVTSEDPSRVVRILRRLYGEPCREAA